MKCGTCGKQPKILLPAFIKTKSKKVVGYTYLTYCFECYLKKSVELTAIIPQHEPAVPKTNK